MGNREIKFRAWDADREPAAMVYPETSGLTSAEILKRFHVVMQYTGLKNKNGVEIYEGDIVDDTFQGRLPIEFVGGAFCTRSENYTTHFNCDWIVIGNIYENPDLLEAK